MYDLFLNILEFNVKICMPKENNRNANCFSTNEKGNFRKIEVMTFDRIELYWKHCEVY